MVKEEDDDKIILGVFRKAKKKKKRKRDVGVIEKIIKRDEKNVTCSKCEV